MLCATSKPFVSQQTSTSPWIHSMLPGYSELAWIQPPVSRESLSDCFAGSHSHSPCSVGWPPSPVVSPWLPPTNHQVFFDLFIDTWYFTFPILQTKADFTVFPEPGAEERLVQLSVGHHKGAQAFTGKFLEDKYVHWVDLGWVRAKSRERQTDSTGPVCLQNRV